MTAPSPTHNTASPTSQITLKNSLQNQINTLNITSKEQLKSSQIQAKLAEILRGSGYEVKQVHWHKLNGSNINRWAELCDGHHHHKPTQSKLPATPAQDHHALHCVGSECQTQVPESSCTGLLCAPTPEKKTPFWGRLLNFFQAA
jgi:hypothetical protein